MQASHVHPALGQQRRVWGVYAPDDIPYLHVQQIARQKSNK